MRERERERDIIISDNSTSMDQWDKKQKVLDLYSVQILIKRGKKNCRDQDSNLGYYGHNVMS